MPLLISNLGKAKWHINFTLNKKSIWKTPVWVRSGSSWNSHAERVWTHIGMTAFDDSRTLATWFERHAYLWPNIVSLRNVPKRVSNIWASGSFCKTIPEAPILTRTLKIVCVFRHFPLTDSGLYCITGTINKWGAAISMEFPGIILEA